MRLSFFKTAQPKQFNYIPRYYDERKEKADERQRRIERELGLEKGASGYKSKLHRGVMAQKISQRRKANRSSTLRLLIIMVLLIMLTLYLFSGNSFSFLLK